MLVPKRHGNIDSYRYGFQGQEKDDELKGEGNSLNYAFRMHDPRVGRFFATDPLTKKYPWYTPYHFSGNRVIDAIEFEGLEPTKRQETIDLYSLPNKKSTDTKTKTITRTVVDVKVYVLIVKEWDKLLGPEPPDRVYSDYNDLTNVEKVRKKLNNDFNSTIQYKEKIEGVKYKYEIEGRMNGNKAVYFNFDVNPVVIPSNLNVPEEIVKDFIISQGISTNKYFVDGKTGEKVYETVYPALYSDRNRSFKMTNGNRKSVDKGLTTGVFIFISQDQAIGHELLHYILPGEPHHDKGLLNTPNPDVLTESEINQIIQHISEKRSENGSNKDKKQDN